MTNQETLVFLRNLIKKADKLDEEIMVSLDVLEGIKNSMDIQSRRIDTLIESKNILVHELDKAKNS